MQKNSKENKTKYRSDRVQILLFILGFITGGLGWIFLIFYRLLRAPKRFAGRSKSPKTPVDKKVE